MTRRLSHAHARGPRPAQPGDIRRQASEKPSQAAEPAGGAVRRSAAPPGARQTRFGVLPLRALHEDPDYLRYPRLPSLPVAGMSEAQAGVAARLMPAAALTTAPAPPRSLALGASPAATKSRPRTSTNAATEPDQCDRSGDTGDGREGFQKPTR